MAVIAKVPSLGKAEVKEIRDRLPAAGARIPLPESVDIEQEEDHEGDPILVMTVVFSRKEKPGDIPWERISPLVNELRHRVFLEAGERIPVIARIRRLSERLPKP